MMDMRSTPSAFLGRRWRWPWQRREEARVPPLTERHLVHDWPSSGDAGAHAERKPRIRWWWIKRGIQASALLFVLLVAWLAITAPLSKSLEPIAPPQLTLLAADGTPIARNGAIVDAPVKVNSPTPWGVVTIKRAGVGGAMTTVWPSLPMSINALCRGMPINCPCLPR